MFRTIWLWFAMNAAIMIVITVSFYLIELIFGISLSTHTWGYIPMLISAAIIGFMGSFFSLMISKWMAKRTYNITPLTIQDYDNLNEKQKIVWDTVSELSRRNNIEMPEVWIYESAEPNAFATGASKNSSLVAVSSGLLEIMDKGAVEWVVWHEMAHIINWDMVTMTLLQWVLNTFVIFISNILANLIENFLDEKFWWLARLWVVIFFQLLLGVLASLIASKFSRYREFRADEGSARFLWKEKMIAWLEALKRMKNIAWEDEWSLASMKISTKTKSWFMNIFSTHPDLDDRIKALKELRI